MDKKEVFEIICNLRSKHGISLGEIKRIQQKEIDRLSSIDKIFEMSSRDDVDLLVALIYLLNENPDDLFEWFIMSHKNCRYLKDSVNTNSLGTVAAFVNVIPFPTKTNFSLSKKINLEYYYKILIAAFIQNPLFFSMAWNWNIFNLNSLEQELKDNNFFSSVITYEMLNKYKKIQCSKVLNRQAASKFGFKEFDNPIEIKGLGTLRAQANVNKDEGISDIQFYIILDEDQKNLKTSFVLDFKELKTSKVYSVAFNINNGTSLLSDVVHNIDFTEGIEILSFELR